ncbi:MAG: TetR/AcrR family transcriptional regulator [Candidatus Cloacimonetes bacterium]|nr:TetR/AcrR family transcriptional regulator [Candidatus Cloacimonadota bacterium]
MNLFTYERVHIKMRNLTKKKKQERRQRIFSNAVYLLKKKGFTNTSMLDIAEKSNLAVGTLYNYYPSKNDLIIAIFNRENQKFLRKINNKLKNLLQSDKNARSIILEVVLQFFNDLIFLSKKNMREIMTALFSSEDYLQKGMEEDLRLISLIEQCLENLKTKNKIKKNIDTNLTAEIIYGIVFEQFIMYCMIPELKKRELRKRLHQQIKILFYGIKPETG